MSKNRQKKTARHRAELILQVRAGNMTAEQAARELGVSRKTYYKWEERGLASMLQGLEDRPPGRPPTPEETLESQQLQNRIRELEAELNAHQKREELRELLRGMQKKKD